MIIYDEYCVTIAFSNVVDVTLLLHLKEEAFGESQEKEGDSKGFDSLIKVFILKSS